MLGGLVVIHCLHVFVIALLSMHLFKKGACWEMRFWGEDVYTVHCANYY